MLHGPNFFIKEVMNRHISIIIILIFFYFSENHLSWMTARNLQPIHESPRWWCSARPLLQLSSVPASWGVLPSVLHLTSYCHCRTFHLFALKISWVAFEVCFMSLLIHIAKHCEIRPPPGSCSWIGQLLLSSSRTELFWHWPQLFSMVFQALWCSWAQLCLLSV